MGRAGKWAEFQKLCPVSLACDGVRHFSSNIAYSLLQSENHQIRESGRCVTFLFRAGALSHQHESPESAFLGHRTSSAHGGGCSSEVGPDQSTWSLTGWCHLSKNQLWLFLDPMIWRHSHHSIAWSMLSPDKGCRENAGHPV